MNPKSDNDTRMRILDAADDLFRTRGYSSVTLRDIADTVGMRHASLYYYAPDGKKQLYVEVMERSFARHREGLAQAITDAGDDFSAQMHAAARWIVTQPPMDISRMAHADMSDLTEEQAARLMQIAYDAIRLPIVDALKQASEAGVIHFSNHDLAAMALVSMVQSVHGIPMRPEGRWRERIGRQLVDMLLQGWLHM
ncbi:MAG: TetR/AcrR family transcriptional regulator [Pleurocapsa minor GSE-CHR-MK-17-07R]|jgi:AcrR family transcriptional regulator|nr:TetR/AcrR family transcriptional regulator [Pleurocapsa minor GSE-CHR-MK 17-07R]